MSFTFDPATPIGKVRIHIDDKAQASAIFSDEEILSFLDDEEDDPKLAAADLLDVIASRTALLQKKIKLGDISTDGPAVAASLREQAANLRAQASTGAAFDVYFA